MQEQAENKTSCSKEQKIINSWNDKTKDRFIELYENFTPHKEIALELKIDSVRLVGIIAKLLGLKMHGKGRKAEHKPKSPVGLPIPHTWKVEGRTRTCTVCGVKQFKSTKFCTFHPSHLSWVPPPQTSCVSKTKTSTKDRNNATKSQAP